MKTLEFYPQGVCSRKMIISYEDGIIKDFVVEGGCNGNLKGIKALILGQKIDEIADKLEGITCGFKGTSCPDQLSKALRKILESSN